MEKLDKKNREPYGTQSLSFFMNSNDIEPTPLATENFFRINITVIKYVYPEVEEREAIREELKTHFEFLLIHPIENSLYSCFNRWRKENQNSQFDFFINAVREKYEVNLRSEFDLHSMRKWKQKDDEPFVNTIRDIVED